MLRENVLIIDNITTVLTDMHTGKTRTFATHNIPLNYQFIALAKWVCGINNTGHNAVLPPTQIIYDSGSGTPAVTDTGPFTPIAGSQTKLSYATPNSPQNGTASLVFQTPAGVITTQVTGAYVEDVNSNGWGHAMYNTPFTPSSTETVTTTYEMTYNS